MTEAILEKLNHREKTIFWSLLGVIFLLSGMYIYFINATIHNVVARQTFEKQASALTVSIGSEEFQYITLENAITLPLAYSLGFKDVTNKTFISEEGLNQVSFLSQ